MGNYIKTFQEIVKEVSEDPENIELLPLCHTTTEGYVVNILHSKNIESKKECDIYHEFLVYFFYGKPSFLTDKQLANYTDNPPITLIFDYDSSYKIKRMLPFDSGGFDRYKIKSGYERGNFTYNHADIAALKGIVKLLYKNNDRYLRDQVAIDDLGRFENICQEIKEIKKLYTEAKVGGDYGRQVYSIEIQYEEKIKFEPQYIILPYSFFTNLFWRENFKKEFPNVIIDYYGMEEIMEADGKSLIASEYQRLMIRKVDQIIKDIQ